jgi:hypothetical protein
LYHELTFRTCQYHMSIHGALWAFGEQLNLVRMCPRCGVSRVFAVYCCPKGGEG